MADNKHKTKAELLDELESIKGLLLEQGEDTDLPSPLDVPLLSQVVNEDNNPGDGEQELDEIRKAYHEALSEQPLPFYTSAAANCDKTIDIEEKIAETLANEQQPDAAAADTLIAAAQEAPISSSNQQSLFDSSDDLPAESPATELATETPEAEPTSPKRRQPRPLPKPAGENPFLPQHIRDRLQANKTPVELVSPTLNVEPANRENLKLQADRLLSEVVRDFLPKIEAELLSRLQSLVNEHLNELKNKADSND